MVPKNMLARRIDRISAFAAASAAAGERCTWREATAGVRHLLKGLV